MKITLVGNIGNDAILRSVGENNTPVTDFSVCENERQADGTYAPVWTKVTLWRGYATAMAEHLKKGRKVLVEGEGKSETYVSGGNVVNSRVHINRNVKITFLDRPETDEAPWAAEEAEEV